MLSILLFIMSFSKKEMLSLPKTSPGKSFFLPPLPAVSTFLSTSYLLGVTKMWLLTQDRYASYTVPVRQYRILQSHFLHCCRHQQPACDLLMLPTQPRA